MPRGNGTIHPNCSIVGRRCVFHLRRRAHDPGNRPAIFLKPLRNSPQSTKAFVRAGVRRDGTNATGNGFGVSRQDKGNPPNDDPQENHHQAPQQGDQIPFGTGEGIFLGPITILKAPVTCGTKSRFPFRGATAHHTRFFRQEILLRDSTPVSVNAPASIPMVTLLTIHKQTPPGGRPPGGVWKTREPPPAYFVAAAAKGAAASAFSRTGAVVVTLDMAS